MTYKTLFTIATEEAGDALEFAIAAAIRWSAHLDVACVSQGAMGGPAMMIPEVGMAGDALLRDAFENLEGLEEKVRARLRSADIGSAVLDDLGRGPDAPRRIAASQRFSDLAILPPPSKSTEAQQMIEAVLYNSRVPVLIAPEAVTPAFDKIILAWDESDVALAAIRASIPLLKQAASVEIVSVDPGSGTTGHALAVMLDRHGIEAPLTAISRSGQSVAKALGTYAQETGADLIVMGAYGHKTLRDVILGGVTQHMLGEVEVPLLVAR